MSYDDIVERYLAFNRLKVIAGQQGVVDVFYPFLLMDVEYGMYQKDIEPLKCEREMKMLKRRWAESYRAFNRKFFHPFDAEQKERVIELMDEYGEWVNTELMMCRVAAMNAIVKAEGFESSFADQQVLTTCLLCNCFAQSANIVWREIYRNRLGEGRIEPGIAGVERYSKEFADAYMRRIGDARVISLKGNKAFEDAMDCLVRKMLHFDKIGKGNG